MMFSNYVQAYDMAKNLDASSSASSNNKRKVMLMRKTKRDAPASFSHPPPTALEKKLHDDSSSEFDDDETTRTCESDSIVLFTSTTTTTTSTTASTLSRSSLTTLTKRAKGLVKLFQGIMATHRQHDKHLQYSVAVHWDRAKARFYDSNETGAVLSLRKVKKVQVERQRVAQAVRYLERTVIELTALISKTKTASRLDVQDSGDHAVSLRAELARFDQVHDRVQALLHPDNEEEEDQAFANKWTREALLGELAALPPPRRGNSFPIRGE